MALSRWWRLATVPAGRPTVPDDRRIYAIGDVHGRADLLDALARLIERDLGDHPGAAPTTIFLGDYVDRGPDSADVIDRLARRDFPTPLVTLRGNHDDLFLAFLRGEIDLAYHNQLGGGATLRSYGIEPSGFARADPSARAMLLADRIPAAHRSFLDALELSVRVGDYFFVHAGVKPGVPLDLQSPEDLLWIREEFLRSTADLGAVVVHGHTPVREPLIRTNGIGIDTHAFASGVLTALVLEGSGTRFLQTAGALR